MHGDFPEKLNVKLKTKRIKPGPWVNSVAAQYPLSSRIYVFLPFIRNCEYLLKYTSIKQNPS